MDRRQKREKELARRFLIAAEASGSGKTIVCCGLLAVLQERGWAVSALKCGPDYIDPMFHRTVLSTPGYNLDTWLMGKDGVCRCLHRQEQARDLLLLEGVMGYYDGIGGNTTKASTYEVAKTTGTPVVLLVDVRGSSVSLAARIKGFLSFREENMIEGVLLNRCSPMLYPRLKELIEQETHTRVYGYLPNEEEASLESRHLGLVIPEEIPDIKGRIEQVRKRMEQTIDIEGLLALAGEAKPVPVPPGLEFVKKVGTGKRIAYAKDEAFCFFYQENLEMLEALGASLIPFSPIHDAELPDNVDGILLYGGYPELYAEALSNNSSMRQSVRQAIDRGVKCMAECGGFLYLQQELTDTEGHTYPMVGVLPGSVHHTGKLTRFGYICLEKGRVFGREVGRIPAHEFHYYDSTENGDAWTAVRASGTGSWKCMVSTDTVFAGFPHLHYGGNPEVAAAFLEG